MSPTSWTSTCSGRAWTPPSAWRRWMGCRRRQRSAGPSRRAPSASWTTWQPTGLSAHCWHRCWRSSGSSWEMPMLSWARRWRLFCCRSRPSPTTWRSCWSWRATGPLLRRARSPLHPHASASLSRSCGAWGCCGSWPSGPSGRCGTCGSSPSTARAAAQHWVCLRASDGSVWMGLSWGGHPCAGLLTGMGTSGSGGAHATNPGTFCFLMGPFPCDGN